MPSSKRDLRWDQHSWLTVCPVLIPEQVFICGAVDFLTVKTKNDVFPCMSMVKYTEH